MLKGKIQNDEYLKLAVSEGREFIVVCEDEKDCNSKRISLYNARRSFSEEEQKFCRIQKIRVEDKWVVRISRNNPSVFEVINGILTPMTKPLQESSKIMLTEMLGQCMKESEIIDALTARGEDKEAVESEIKRLSL